MKKPLQIINIDGLDGIGKSTQINVLAAHYKNQGVSVEIIHLDDQIDSALETAQKTWDFLEKNPDSLVICDGSIGRMIVIDLISGVHQLNIMEKYRKVLHWHERLNHKYGMVNILMTINNLQECSDRIIKREKLLGNVSEGILDFQKEKDIVMAMRRFDDNIISRDLKFHNFEIEDDWSIIMVRESLVEYLDENFQIKKPSK